jgi:hypothetical protein
MAPEAAVTGHHTVGGLAVRWRVNGNCLRLPSPWLATQPGSPIHRHTKLSDVNATSRNKKVLHVPRCLNLDSLLSFTFEVTSYACI